MKKVDEVKVLTIDGVPHVVDSMSEEIKSMVEVFNDWNQKESDMSNELMIIKAAKNDLSRQIILQVRKEQEDANDKVPDVDETQPEDPTNE